VSPEPEPTFHRLFGSLRAVEVLSLERPAPFKLNPRGERVLAYLRARRRREMNG